MKTAKPLLHNSLMERRKKTSSYDNHGEISYNYIYGTVFIIAY